MYWASYPNKLISPLFLNSHSIVRNSNLNIVNLCEDYSGLHIASIYHLQGVVKLRFLHMHYRNEDTTRKLLKSVCAIHNRNLIYQNHFTLVISIMGYTFIAIHIWMPQQATWKMSMVSCNWKRIQKKTGETMDMIFFND